MSRLGGAVLLACLPWIPSAQAAGADGPSPATVRFPRCPFPAIVTAEASYVRLRADAKSPEVGLLHRGATVEVTGCSPDCEARDGWALLAPYGAVRLSVLRADDGSKPGAEPPRLAAEQLEYARVGPKGTRVYRQPDPAARLISRRRMPRDLALLPNPDLRARGWRERIEGGFVRSRAVEALQPSRFRGEADPRLPLAFVIREIGSKKTPSAARLHRYDRFTVRGLQGTLVVTDRGPLPRRAVRLVALRSPPPGIPIGAKWVHVDLAEQTLTAYEGVRPALSTLMSSGKPKPETATHPGLYQVQHKMLYSSMDGEPEDPYAADRVPYALYFRKDEALHGVYWHDSFGLAASHGCVNLSLGDAKWLFEWAPPALPAGWTVVAADAAEVPALWVLVEKRAPLDGVPRQSPVAAPPPTPALPAATDHGAPRPLGPSGGLIIPVHGIAAEQLVDTYRAARSGGRVHDAIDIHAPRNTPVVAAIAGRVLKLTSSLRGGVTVNQLGDDGETVYYYAHLDRYAAGLADGQYMKQGDLLGYVGDTGNAAPGNYHLHFAIWRIANVSRYWDGTNLNPYPLLRHPK